MPGTTITGSSNIAVLDMRIIASLCAGTFCFDLSPSQYISTGETLVQGAKFQVTDPYNVIIRPYPSSFDVAPAFSPGMDGPVCISIPTLAGNYKYGKYTITAELTDQNGTKYYVTKTVTICVPDSKNKTRNYGSLSARITSSCKDGKVVIILDTPPNYNGKVFETQTIDVDLDYPTSSGEDTISFNIGAFSIQLYEGTYKLVGEICARYNFTDNVFVDVKYKIKKEHNVRCLIDECCVYEALEELNMRLTTDCTEKEKEATANTILEAVMYLKQIELAAACGKDATSYIESLESLLGCTCTCNCAEGTPIINTSPAKDFIINGCNVDKETVGLTDTYTINNYEYVVGVVENGGVMVVATAILSGCTKTQNITFNIATAYSQIKGLANASDVEASFWAAVINKMLTYVDGSCISSTWAGMSLAQRVEAIVNKICGCCNCAATIDSSSTARDGADVIISWTDTGEFLVDIYMDGVYQGSVLNTVDSFRIVGAANGVEHSYVLMTRCSNNKFGATATGTFTYIGCPTITPPVVSANSVNAACPYDLTSLTSAPPAGITYEWHTLNNTDASSLHADPTEASSGVYYVFAKDSTGCYSIATQVTLVCIAATSCTAPQSLLVSSATGGFLVQFQSAAFPPPSSSYTVKRRLQADPDVDGSYTTIGTPAFNSSTSRWEILDTTASNNTLYVYKAISNCGGSPPSTPYITYEYANITCPTNTLTPAETSIAYSFTHVGGGVDKYDVQLYDSTGTTLLATNTHNPAFPTPVTGSFTGLSASTSYRVRIIVYIGSYTRTCSMQSTSTSAAASGVIYWAMNGVVGARLTIVDGASPANSLLNELSTLTPKSGTLTGLTGTATICAEWASGSGNVIKMRICDAFGNEVYYDGNIIVGDPASCYTTVTLPSSSSPYQVFVTAGDVEPNSFFK
jgi:hypothetical protein